MLLFNLTEYFVKKEKTFRKKWEKSKFNFFGKDLFSSEGSLSLSLHLKWATRGWMSNVNGHSTKQNIQQQKTQKTSNKFVSPSLHSCIFLFPDNLIFATFWKVNFWIKMTIHILTTFVNSIMKKWCPTIKWNENFKVDNYTLCCVSQI